MSQNTKLGSTLSLELLDARFMPLALCQIEQALSVAFGWNIDTFSAIKLFYSDDSVSIALEFPDDLVQWSSLEEEIELILDRKMTEMGYC